MIRKTVIQYITLTSLYSFAMSTIAAVYVTFLTSHGLNLFEVNMVNFVFFSTLFICEIPTGAFADLFGRKTSFVTACFLLSAGTFLYAWSTSFWGFAMSEAISAVGATFASGAFQAWLVDKLRHHEYDGPLHPIFSKAKMYGVAAGIISSLIGARLADIRIDLPWMFMGSVLFVTGIIALFWLKEEYFVKKEFSFRLGVEAMKETIKQSIEFGISNKVVRFIIVIGLIQIFAVQAPNMQWQPYFIRFVIEKKNLGYVWIGMMSALMIGSLIAPKFLLLIKDEKRSLILCQVGAGVGIGLTTLLSFRFGVAVFMLHEIPRGMFQPLKDKFLQDNIPSHARATISSLESISPHLGGMIGLVTSGFIANRFSIQSAWVSSGLLLVILTLIVSKNGKRAR